MTTESQLYWRTRFGSLCERQAGPDARGFLTVLRLSDNAVREWRMSEMTPVTDAEAANCLIAHHLVQS